MKKRVLLAASGAAGLLAGGGALTAMAVKDQTYVPSPPYEPQAAQNAQVAVVYYSRSGHSEAVAREIARRFNAPIVRVDADYPRTFSGQRKAVSDARSQALPQIRVEAADLALTHRLFLVSPTWMFRPATPLWAYVEQANLAGKEVALVTTGNSRFEQVEIDAFAQRVKARGGHLTDHLFLRRGRIYWQRSREELLKEVHEKIDLLKSSTYGGGNMIDTARQASGPDLTSTPADRLVHTSIVR